MKKASIIFISLFLLTLPTLLPFFNTKFFYTQDYIFIARLQQMSVALSSGQFPVRWAPDLRYGEPLFNFYAPLPYYLGALIKLSGLNFIWVAKMLFILSSLLSAVTMYIFCSKFFNQKVAFLATALYIYAPYRAVDIYVRGALSETWSFVFFPLIFYTSFLLSKKIDLARISFLALSLAGLFLTHNITIVMFAPFLVIYWLYLIFKTMNGKLFFSLGIASILGTGLAAFYLLPALFERQFIQTQYLIVGYFNFRAHFVAISQFFSTFWGYGTSMWGLDDGLSFQVGLVHWVIVVLAFILGILFRRNKKLVGLLLVLGFSFFLSLLLQHNKSAIIWEAIPIMAFIQFPWRFLEISVFIVSITGAVIAEYFIGRLRVIYFILIIALVLVNFQYFRPKEYVDDSFFDKFQNIETLHKGVDLTKDYLPIWVQTTDEERFDTPRAEKGEIKILSLKRNSIMLDTSINVLSDSLIELPVTYFPGWQVEVNNQLITQSSPSKMGLIRFKLPKGNYLINAEFKNTSVRTTGSIVSIISILIVMLFISLRKKYYDS